MSNLTTDTNNQDLVNSTLDRRYIRRLMPDPSGGFTASIHEFPGCIAEGDTAEEALINLESAALSWKRSAEANGYPVMQPIDYEGASGKIALRISRRLHQLAVERAELEGVSMNQFIGNALANYLGQQDGMRRLALELHKAVRSNLYFFYQHNLLSIRGNSTNELRVIPEMKIREISSSSLNLEIKGSTESKLFMEVSNV